MHDETEVDSPENSISAFQSAIQMGVDAIEFDVRLPVNYVPIVYHSYYLEHITALNDLMFKHTDQQIKESAMFLGDGFSSANKTPTLYEVLEIIGGQIGLEIEIKGPEQESSEIVAKALQPFERFNDFLEIISYEPLLSRVFDVHC